MPSIPELAQRLGRLTTSIPTDVGDHVRSDLDFVERGVREALGDAAGRNELREHLEHALDQATHLEAALVQLRRVLADVSVYHQQGGNRDAEH